MYRNRWPETGFLPPCQVRRRLIAVQRQETSLNLMPRKYGNLQKGIVTAMMSRSMTIKSGIRRSYDSLRHILAIVIWFRIDRISVRTVHPVSDPDVYALRVML